MDDLEHFYPLLAYAFLLLAVGYSANRFRQTTGPESLIGEHVLVESDFTSTPGGARGPVLLHGELWTGVVDQVSPPPSRGDLLEIMALDGLTLQLRPRQSAAHQANAADEAPEA